jgi:hypothetical protein
MEEQTEIVSLKVSDSVTIMAEATSLGGEERVGVSEILDFEGITDAIEAIATSITGTLAKVKPKKASVEFSLKIGVESGKLTSLLVKGTGEGNLKITLEWGE